MFVFPIFKGFHAARMWRVWQSTILVLGIALLAACGQGTPEPTHTANPTGIPSHTPAEPTRTPQPAATWTPGPTPSSPTPTNFAAAPQITSTPTVALPTAPVPEGLRMAYTLNHNLYLQDGGNPPVQLTSSGEDSHPVFSDDGEVIAFFRGAVPHNLYAIEVDGSGERALVTNDMLLALGQGYDELSEVDNLSFVPGSHKLLFNTHKRNPNGLTTTFGDLLMTDTDTGEFRSLIPAGQVGGFKVSPDGRLVAINKSGHVDILNIDGQIVHRNLITYVPSEPIELFPQMYWILDLSELIVLQPRETYYDMEGTVTYTVWRYPLDNSSAIQVPLDPLPKGEFHSVSLDGKWITYEYTDFTDEPISELYIGDLSKGGTLLLTIGGKPTRWSNDSTHFVYEDSIDIYMGVVGGSLSHIDQGRFLGWIDATRYLYFYIPSGAIVMGDISGNRVLISNNLPVELLTGSAGEFSFIFLD